MHPTPDSPHDIRRVDLTLPNLIGLHAVRLLEWAREAGQDGLIYVAEGDSRAEQLYQAVRGLAPDMEIHHLRPWDCLPYDSASPSRDVMGQRMSVLHRMAEPGNAVRLVISSPAALVQRVPPRGIWRKASYQLEAGKPFSQGELEDYLSRAGYIIDERVDEPGEAAIRGQVIDIFPPNSPIPYRAEHDGAAVLAIRAYDPISQRTTDVVERLVLEPASEVVLVGEKHGDPVERYPGMEHRLPDFYPNLETVLDYWPQAAVAVEARAEERRQVVMEQISDAYESRTRLRNGGSPPASAAAVSPGRLFMEDEEWGDCLSRHRLTVINLASGEDTKASAVPRFASTSKPTHALSDFIERQKACGRKIVLAAGSRRDLNRMRRRVQPLQVSPYPVTCWDEVMAGTPGDWFALQADLKSGFVDEQQGVTVIAASDLLGSRVSSDATQGLSSATLQFADTEFRLGDAVIHLDHGIGLLDGIETVAAGEAGTGDAIRLRYAGDTMLIIPAAEMERVWRYGAASDSVSLDRLNSDAWQARRAKIANDLQETAKRLVALINERKVVTLSPLAPPDREYERFVARFPFLETPDQSRAIEDVLNDLASGRPMDRLVCGDVGFGKTEVALRAAAAVALAGKQVALVAPTTVLARQHLRTFERRFAGLGIKVAHLSRLVSAGEAREVRKGLADGSIHIVIGTHAVAGKGVKFKDLGLLAIDEEQRFGVAHKKRLREMAAGGHVLTLTATPIPRTLQAALVGLQDLSIIATPPARRQPIRTFLTPFDPATVREALMRERRRNGQSFVVCSRVEDIEPIRSKLAELVPELNVVVAHGQMPPAETDEAMVRFADGEGDVLLATNIIESGLDVPRANTMLVWRADRFGLSQLHQLRGRVGRARIRGVTYLLTDPEQELPKATERRLRTLEALDRLGAGFAISAHDLDLRGAGELLGEEQAGHIKLIGVDLYRSMLERAMRGEGLDGEWTPELNIGLTGMIPEEYVNEPEVRINLHARLARPDLTETVDDLEAEVEDRFGPIPEPVRNLLDLANMKRFCMHLGIGRVDAGPQAIALTFRPGAAENLPLQQLTEHSKGELRWSGERLILAQPEDSPANRLRNILDVLNRLQ